MPPEDLQDLIETLSRTPEIVAELVKDLSDSEFRLKRSPEEFSVLENVCHLRDIEIEGYTARITRILRETNPLLSDIDGTRLALERAYQSQDLSQALQEFAGARKQNTQTLSSLDSEQFEREGTMEGLGRVSIRGLLVMMRDHDASHVRELSSIRERSNIAG